MANKTTKRSTKPAGKIPTNLNMFNEAQAKLRTARAIIDVIAMLEVSGGTDTLAKGSLTGCLLHSEELLADAYQMFMDAPVGSAEVNHA